jgi:hypothetical protein
VLDKIKVNSSASKVDARPNLQPTRRVRVEVNLNLTLFQVHGSTLFAKFVSLEQVLKTSACHSKSPVDGTDGGAQPRTILQHFS